MVSQQVTSAAAIIAALVLLCNPVAPTLESRYDAFLGLRKQLWRIVLPLFAHHVEINLFDLIVIEPETMPEHAVLAAISALVIGLVVYGLRAAGTGRTRFL